MVVYRTCEFFGHISKVIIIVIIILNYVLRHPFGGQLNVNDVILRVNQMEPTRRVISTLNNTSKYVAETGSRLKSWVKNVVNTNNQSENSQ